MTTFIETRFPIDIAYGSKGGSGFNTTIFETASGYEQRNINWSRSRAEYDISYGIRNKTDMDIVVNFFMAMMGRAYAFRFKDWGDFYIANQQIGVGNGSTATFQLVKTYTVGGQSFTRTINKPVAGTITSLLVNGVPQTVTTNYTLDTTTGIFTFTGGHIPAAAATIVVSYIEFDVPCRFDVDKLDVSQDYFQAETWSGIKLVEVRL